MREFHLGVSRPKKTEYFSIEISLKNSAPMADFIENSWENLKNPFQKIGFCHFSMRKASKLTKNLLHNDLFSRLRSWCSLRETFFAVLLNWTASIRPKTASFPGVPFRNSGRIYSRSIFSTNGAPHSENGSGEVSGCQNWTARCRTPVRRHGLHFLPFWSRELAILREKLVLLTVARWIFVENFKKESKIEQDLFA